MAKSKLRHRQPTADEQTVLKGMSVRLLTRPEEVQQANQILTRNHYLHNANLMVEHLRNAVIWRGQLLGFARSASPPRGAPPKAAKLPV